MDAGQLSMSFIGWLDEFAPEYATWLPAKTYDTLQDLFDELIDLVSRETDFAKAEKLYFELNRLAHEYAINAGHIQLLARHYEQLWGRGWYYNPAYPGEYFYVLWQEDWGKAEGGPRDTRAPLASS